MKNPTLALWGTLSAVVLGGPVLAYEMPTHFRLSEQAALKSALGQPDLRADLGFYRTIDDMTQTYPSTEGDQDEHFEPRCKHGSRLTVQLLIACGAEFEDAPSDRSLNHFFDPGRDAPLTYGLFQPGETSPDWILEDDGEVDGQDFSYRNAREYFYRALTSPPLSQREENWGKLFQTLGQVIHHLQDMAQPQHVRNDIHCDDELQCRPAAAVLDGVYRPSKYEKYSKRPDVMDRSITPLAASADGAFVYPGPGNAHVSVFDTPRKFFIGNEKGIAEFTNLNFVSEGTNFRYENGMAQANYDFYKPIPGQAVSYSVLELLLLEGVPPFLRFACGIDPRDCYVDFYHTEVSDALTHQTVTNTRAASLSIFDSDLERFANGADFFLVSPITGEPYATQKLFTLNRFNFDAAHAFLIPRAVAYSAGLINYFFRGKLEISLPDEGVYGLVDHATLTGIDPAAGFRGFDKIKLKLRNATPQDEAMSGGRLVAVVKFRRNLCYHDDLEGSYPPAANGYECTSPREEIVVSGEQTGVALTDAARPFEFGFAQAVPINATDVRLQVVYRGVLGAETDAVAVATRDIAEPTFFSYLNATDYIRIDGKVYTREQIDRSEALLRRVYPSSCVDPRTAQLDPDCLNPFPVTMQFSLGNGDGSDPGTDDDRETAMGPIADKTPYAVIMT